MDATELGEIVDRELKDSMGYFGGELSAQRSKALTYYRGEPMGNERVGRSRVVMTEVQEAVDWIKPSLLRIFASERDVVSFDAVGEDDDDKAKQETEYCSMVYWDQNDGFLNTYSWIHDALLQKNGIMKISSATKDKYRRESYKGLNQLELETLVQDPAVEIRKIEEREGDEGVIVYDVLLRSKISSQAKIDICPVPPEEYLICRDHNSISLDRVRFQAHRRIVTYADLRELGFKDSELEDLPFGAGREGSDEAIERDQVSDESQDITSDFIDRSQRQVWASECYLWVDADDDGLPEFHKILRIGDKNLSDDLLDDDYQPFIAITPNIQPHRFLGRSIYDALKDLQEIKSVLVRGMVDNLYLTNDPQREVVTDWVKNLSDLAVSTPGHNIPVSREGAIRSLEVPFTAQASFPFLEYIDGIKKNRVGIGDEVAGLDLGSLANINTGVAAQAFEAAHMRIELIARIIAEVGFRPLWQQIHQLLRKNPQSATKQIRISGNWVPIDPREWAERDDITVNVGIGTGNRQQRSIALQTVIDLQKAIVEQGGMDRLVKQKGIFNALTDYQRQLGLPSPVRYFLDPDTVDPPQPQPTEADKLAQVQMESIKAEMQISRERLALDLQRLQLDAQKAQAESVRKDAELQIKTQLEAIRVQMDRFATFAEGVKDLVSVGQPAPKDEKRIITP